MSISAVFAFVNCPFFALNRRQFIPQDFSTMDSGNKIIFRRALNHCESEREQEKKKSQKSSSQPFLQTFYHRFQIRLCATFNHPAKHTTDVNMS